VCRATRCAARGGARGERWCPSKYCVTLLWSSSCSNEASVYSDAPFECSHYPKRATPIGYTSTHAFWVCDGAACAQIRLSNEKIAAVLVAVEGAKTAMLTMGWVEDGEFLVLPAGAQLSMKEVRDIEDAKIKLKKEEEQALMRAAMPKKKEDPEMKRLREQLEADKRERAARGPITQGSVAAPRGNGGIVQFQPPAQSG